MHIRKRSRHNSVQNNLSVSENQFPVFSVVHEIGFLKEKNINALLLGTDQAFI